MAVFPIKESKWHEVKTAWKDLIPGRTILPDLGASDGFRPGDIKYIHFGKSWNFNIYHKSPEITFSVDELKLIKGIQGTRSRVGLEKFPPLKNAVRKLRSRKSVTILALGDSITWGNGVGGNANAYPASLGKMLKTYYKNINIKVENRAIGGSTTVKARRWLMRDIKGIEADIVTVMFGYNEMPKSVEEREKYTEAFTKQLITYLEEVAGLMKTPPACIIITTIPGKKKHWETLDCYAVGIREIGRKYKNITIADINKHFKGIGRNGYIPYMRNEAHPSAKGYQEMADQLFKIITGKIKNK